MLPHIYLNSKVKIILSIFSWIYIFTRMEGETQKFLSLVSNLFKFSPFEQPAGVIPDYNDLTPESQTQMRRNTYLTPKRGETIVEFHCRVLTISHIRYTSLICRLSREYIYFPPIHAAQGKVNDISIFVSKKPLKTIFHALFWENPRIEVFIFTIFSIQGGFFALYRPLVYITCRKPDGAKSQ